MRKRLLALLISGVLLGLSACGNADTEESKEAGKVATEESKEAMVSTQEASIGTEEPGEEMASTEEMPEVSPEDPDEATEDLETDESTLESAGESVLVWTDRIWRYQPCHYEPELGHYLFGAEVKYDIFTMKEDTYPALAKIVDAFNTKQAENGQEQFDRLVKMVDEDYPEYGLTERDATYEYEKKLYPIRTDKKVVSVLEREYFHEDKRGEYFYFGATNFDVQSGKELTLENIFKSGTDWSAILKTKLQENYPAFTYDAQALVEENLIWTVGYKGVSVYFNGTDMNQPIKVSVTYDEYPDIFAKDYLPDEKELLFAEPEGDYVQLLTGWDNNKTIVALDLYGDGKKDYVQFSYEDSYYNIIVNDNACFNWDNDSLYFDYLYLVKNDDSYYLYLQMYYDNDIRTIEMFAISPDSIMYLGKRGGELENFTDPKHFVIRDYMNMLMSKHVEADCYIGTNGEPVLSKGVYNIEPREDERTYDYISRVDIPAELVDEQGNQLGTTYTFPAGTEFTLIRTDGETYVDAKTGDGKYCRLYTEPAGLCDYRPTVNGLDAETCFGILGFAG